ncbi:hypothetical protein J6P11_00515 [bacterium]|nr:hypothetical protein [bacterium]
MKIYSVPFFTGVFIKKKVYKNISNILSLFSVKDLSIYRGEDTILCYLTYLYSNTFFISNIKYIYNKETTTSLTTKKWNYHLISSEDKKIIYCLSRINEMLDYIDSGKKSLVSFLYLRILFSKLFFYWSGIKNAKKVKNIAINLNIKSIKSVVLIDHLKKYLLLHPFIFNFAINLMRILRKSK